MVGQANLSDDGESSTLKSDKKHRLKQRFDVRQKLGQGTYGKVQLALNRETGQEVAIKTIKKSKIESEQDLIRIRREIQIMSSIQHPHIIHIYEVFENKDKIVLVMQFACGGELYDYLSEKKVLPDLEARRIFRQIAAAVYYCHKNRICHRDLKLENILLDEKGNAKIADFGLSNVFDERHLLKTYCGSPLYASPEIVKGVPYYGPEVDCWSMGVLLYTLVYGAMPFDGSNFKKLVTQISEGDYFEPKKKSKASDLIHRLLAVNPLKRATIVDICTDHWVNQGYEHSLLQVSEDMANLTPVRLDLLLALAPGSPVPSAEDLKEQIKQEEEEQNEEKVAPNRSEEEEEEDEDEDDDGPETMANSFAFVRGSQVSNLSVSSPDLPKLGSLVGSEADFLSASMAAAALEAQSSKRAAEMSFSSGLTHVPSTAHKSKKTRKSDSATLNIAADAKKIETGELSSADTAQVPSPKSESVKKDDVDVVSNVKTSNSTSTDVESVTSNKTQSENRVARKLSNISLGSSTENDKLLSQEETGGLQNRRMGRAPGKIVIPKTFESPQSSPTEKKPLLKSKSKDEAQNVCDETLEKSDSTKGPVESVDSKNNSSSETVVKAPTSVEPVSEEKKLFAKGVLKKGIAKAKLAERKLSQQSSVDSETGTLVSSVGKPAESVTSFYKMPRPYSKEEEQQNMKSKAEITLSSAKTCDTAEIVSSNSTAPLWDSVSNNSSSMKQLQNRNLSWGTISSTLDSEMSGWKEQMEESLRRLSPDGSAEKSVSPINTPCRLDDDKPLVPIARSYKKFTFTKDGACITETKKIYTTPGADGSWTKVEKKTKITTRPGNAEEFERFRDLHLRNDSPLTRSDSQSSSGSNEVYDDIFDSWTGDTMMCNMMKIKNMFNKFSRDPFMHSDRRRNPFRNFRRTESDRVRRLRSGHSSEKESSDVDDYDCDIAFDDGNPVVYGSQGLWQFLQSPSKRLPRCVRISPPERSTFARSVSQDRSGTKMSNWKQCESRASSGYNTNSRSQSPHEKVLRFVFESPSPEYDSSTMSKRDSFGIKRNTRRDSGVTSDSYESDQFYKRVPSDDFSKSGRVSPISSTYNSGRPTLIKDFVKSWPKEMFTRSSMSGEGTDNRRSKVEQWLHMNDMNNESFPFGFYSDTPPRVPPRKSGMHDNVSTTYATMRPREYMKYSRSSSDKAGDCSGEFFPFEEATRRRHMMNAQNKDPDPLKSRTRSSTYSPVSEESSREAHSLRNSDSSQSNTSVHHINFTISDGRVSTSQSTSPLMRQMGSCEGDRRTEGNSICVEQTSPKSGQPIVQMRVSFNRGNNKVVHSSPQSPPSSMGLWQQQDQLSSPKSLNPTAREISPVPGIKKFSTEMVHTVGSTAEHQEKGRSKHQSGPTSIECEVKTTINPSKGKYDCLNRSVCGEAHSDACSDSCMESARKNTNINLLPQYLQFSNTLGLNEDAFTLPKFDTTDVNTPDSLEDTSFGQKSSHLEPPEYNEDTQLDNLHLDIKPLGVLWNNCEAANPTDNSNSASEYENCTRSMDPETKSQIWRGSPYNDFGSIWEQRNNNCQTFDLIKELLSDDGFDNIIQKSCEKDHSSAGVREPPRLKTGLSVLDTLSVIDDCKLKKSGEADKLRGIMPSLMDDLQSPKKVLHQALRIGEFLKTCE